MKTTTDLTPYAYTPYTTPLTCRTFSDGTIKYEHTRTDAILKGANHA